MTTFRQFVWENHPDSDFLFPLHDEEGNQYNDAQEAKPAYEQGKTLFHLHDLTSGVVILERFLCDDNWGLYPVNQDLEGQLLASASQLGYREHVVKMGIPLMCKGREVLVFGGYGKTLQGHNWAVTEINTHDPHHHGLLMALIQEGLLTDQQAQIWEQGPPDDCEGDHYLVM